MPIYVYECESCGKFEVMQKMSDNVLTECPTCHGKVQKLISAPGALLFKGTGFYETDYKKPNKGEE